MACFWYVNDGMSALRISKSDLESKQNTLLAIRDAADLVVNDELTPDNFEDPGWVVLWPDRVREDGVWKANTKYPNAQSVLDAFEADGFHPMGVGCLNRFGKAAVTVRVESSQYCEFLQWVSKERFILESLSAAPVSVGMLTVGVVSAKRPTCSQAIPRAIVKARAMLEERFPGLHWGRPDPTKNNVYAIQVTTPQSLTDADAFTHEMRGCKIAFSARTTGMRRAEVAKIIEEAATTKVADYKTSTEDLTDAQFEIDTVKTLVGSAQAAVSETFDRWQGLRLSEATCKAVVKTAFSVPLDTEPVVQAVTNAFASFASPADILRSNAHASNDEVRALRDALAEEPPKVPPSKLLLVATTYKPKAVHSAKPSAQQTKSAQGRSSHQQSSAPTKKNGVASTAAASTRTQARTATPASRPTAASRNWATVARQGQRK
jgi:hypothetical protein